MWTQSLLDFTDIAILVAFAASMLAFIVYMWRTTRRSHRDDQLS